MPRFWPDANSSALDRDAANLEEITESVAGLRSTPPIRLLPAVGVQIGRVREPPSASHSAIALHANGFPAKLPTR